VRDQEGFKFLKTLCASELWDRKLCWLPSKRKESSLKKYLHFSLTNNVRRIVWIISTHRDNGKRITFSEQSLEILQVLGRQMQLQSIRHVGGAIDEWMNESSAIKSSLGNKIHEVVQETTNKLFIKLTRQSQVAGWSLLRRNIAMASTLAAKFMFCPSYWMFSVRTLWMWPARLFPAWLSDSIFWTIFYISLFNEMSTPSNIRIKISDERVEWIVNV